MGKIRTAGSEPDNMTYFQLMEAARYLIKNKPLPASFLTEHDDIESSDWEFDDESSGGE